MVEVVAPVSVEAPLSAEQRALVASAVEVVTVEVRTLARRLAWRLDAEEMAALGHVGLAEAARDFDPEVGGDFRRFVRYRVRGAILDGYLKEAREQARVHALCSRAGYGVISRAKRYGDVMTDMDGKAEERLLDHLGGVAMSVFAAAVGVDTAGDAEEALRRQQGHARGYATLRRMIGRLTPREAEVVTRHYVGEETLPAIGASLRVSRAGVYRLHDRAIHQLAVLMRLEGTTELPPREDEL